MTEYITLENKQTRLRFLPTGDLYEIDSNGMMINQLNGNPLDGSLNQLYLRVFTSEGIQWTPMIGSNSASKFGYSQQQLTWKGNFLGTDYQVDLQLEEDCWFWRVQLQGAQKVDVIYGQDLGNAAKGAVQSNEAYVSQYIDHHVSQDKDAIVVSSRQNQPQAGKFPLVEQGSFQPLRGYSTDGYQFFGRAYKATNVPQALGQETLANEVYQYEFAYIALQTEVYQLSEKPTEIVFYAAVKEDQPEAVSGPQFDSSNLQKRFEQLTFEPVVTHTLPTKQLGQPLVGETLSEADISALFPHQESVEEIDGQIYSFFTENYRHVVLKEKETAMERAHGHILLSGSDLVVDQPLLSTTVYMYGIFNSQIVLGNTSMNKLLSNSRNSLNVIKRSGQRIYVKEQENWRLLTMPSAFEMGLNSATWYYKTPEDLILVTTYTVLDGREIRTTIQSKNGHSYSWAISNQFVMGADEEVPTAVVTREQQVTITSAATSPVKEAYPELTYYLQTEQPFELVDDSLFLHENSDGALTILTFANQATIEYTIQGTLTGSPYQEQRTTKQQEEENYVAFIDSLLNQFELAHDQVEVQTLNLLARWYTHNMLVHYLSPHGLEQYGGAAWGTRDVSQGPTEFFLAVNRPEIVASIIQHLFANQFEDDGNWPQWFMFDRYEKQKADESHGDVIVWPMKVVSDYLEKTNDFEILATQLPYTNRATFLKTEQTASLYEHLQKEIAYIEANFLEGTYLSCYGDGDWDDTLQPNNSKLKKHMASSWTVALTYEVMKKLATQLEEYDADYAAHLQTIVQGIQADFEKYILSSGTIPGFVYMEDPEHVELMIHPSDQKTGIQYRLLPMQQSMIGELLSPEQAEHHLAIIKKHLQHPDGVRLMNHPAAYHGGVSTNFKRAEQAANFGREIGLQYVHAHIRFTEAMAKLGHKEETWHGLGVINPIQIQERVPNAELRQSNVYFSSSDGDFKTRLEAQENFGKLREGSVGVKGGWRVYSSGPGIYMNQLLSNVLGIRELADCLLLDPVLPTELAELTVTYRVFNRPVKIKFHEAENEQVIINGQSIDYTLQENRYRQGAFCMEKAEVLALLKEENNQIDIYR
jgi:cellobiose phosphorylase